MKLCYDSDLGWGPQIAQDGAGHQKEQMIKGLELSALSTNLWEGGVWGEEEGSCAPHAD